MIASTFLADSNFLDSISSLRYVSEKHIFSHQVFLLGQATAKATAFPGTQFNFCVCVCVAAFA